VVSAVASKYNYFILLKDPAPKSFQRYRIVSQSADMASMLADWNQIMAGVLPQIRAMEPAGTVEPI
jgi:hypothetical protein